MTLAMAGFALEDMFIKLLSGTIPVGQILFMLGPAAPWSSEPLHAQRAALFSPIWPAAP